MSTDPIFHDFVVPTRNLLHKNSDRNHSSWLSRDFIVWFRISMISIRIFDTRLLTVVD